MPNINYQQVIPFKGKSMSPLIKEGDKVVVDLYGQPSRVTEKMQGKICFYNDGNEWVLHRVLGFEDDFYIKGDFAKSFDCNPELNIWGEVCQVKTKSGKTIYLNNKSKLNILSEKLSVVHMTNKGVKGKLGKLLLYLLNIARRGL